MVRLSNSLEVTFLVLSILQFTILLTQDTVNMFPLNDIQHLKASMSLKERSLMVLGNTLFFFIAIVLQIIYFGQPKPLAVGVYCVLLYSINLYLMYQQWYKYYWFGANEEVCNKYALEYGRTLNILPAHRDYPRPNLLHVVLHTFFLCNTALAVVVGLNLT
jgi:hypothetical protein